MKQVTVYTVKKEVVPSYGSTIPKHSYLGLSDIRFEGGEFFPKSAIETIHLPIEKFRWQDGREVFVAFDEELLELIGCLQDQKDAEISKAVNKQVDIKIEKIQNSSKTMTFWQRVKFVLFNKLEVI